MKQLNERLDAVYDMVKEVTDSMEKLQAENAQLRKEMEWIGVEERLPEDDFERYYMVNGEYPTYIVKIDIGVIATVLEFDGEAWLDEAGEKYNVTHWMPLPEPPNCNVDDQEVEDG